MQLINLDVLGDSPVHRVILHIMAPCMLLVCSSAAVQPSSGCRRNSVCCRLRVFRETNTKCRCWQEENHLGACPSCLLLLTFCITVASETLPLNSGLPFAWHCTTAERFDCCPDGSVGQIDEKHKGLKKSESNDFHHTGK